MHGDLHVEDYVDAARGNEEFGNVDAVAWGSWDPQFFDGGTFKDDGEGGRDQGGTDKYSES